MIDQNEFNRMRELSEQGTTRLLGAIAIRLLDTAIRQKQAELDDGKPVTFSKAGIIDQVIASFDNPSQTIVRNMLIQLIDGYPSIAVLKWHPQ